MELLFRFAVFLPVLFLIAIVVVGQQHSDARELIPAALKRSVRWTVWSVVLVLVMTVLEVLFIGW